MNEDELNALKARVDDCCKEMGHGVCAEIFDRIWQWVKTAEDYAKFKLERERYK